MPTKIQNVVTINLTDEQLKILKPVLDRIDECVKNGDHGLAIGQLWFVPSREGEAYFGYVEPDLALEVAKILYPDDDFNRQIFAEQAMRLANFACSSDLATLGG